MSKKDTEKALAGLGKKPPTVYCKRCKTWYAPNIPDIARYHVGKTCKKR